MWNHFFNNIVTADNRDCLSYFFTSTNFRGQSDYMAVVFINQKCIVLRSMLLLITVREDGSPFLFIDMVSKKSQLI